MTVCIIGDDGERFTIDLVLVTSRDKIIEAVPKIIEQVQEYAEIRRVLLDRGFHGVLMINALGKYVVGGEPPGDFLSKCVYRWKGETTLKPASTGILLGSVPGLRSLPTISFARALMIKALISTGERFLIRAPVSNVPEIVLEGAEDQVNVKLDHEMTRSNPSYESAVVNVLARPYDYEDVDAWAFATNMDVTEESTETLMGQFSDRWGIEALLD